MTVAVRKKNAPKELRISTPKSRRLKWMAEAGIVVPETIPLDEEKVPLDFTRLSSRGIGELQSRYAVRYSHIIYNIALLESDVLHLRRELRIAQSKFRIRNPNKAKNVVDAMARIELGGGVYALLRRDKYGGQWVATSDDLAADIPTDVVPLRDILEAKFSKRPKTLKEMWLRITKRAVDVDALTREVADGNLTAEEIAPAYFEKEKAPFLRVYGD